MNEPKNHSHMERRPLVFLIESGDHSGQNCEESPDWTWFVNIFVFTNPSLKNGPYSVITDSRQVWRTASVEHFAHSLEEETEKTLGCVLETLKASHNHRNKNFRLTVSHCYCILITSHPCRVSQTLQWAFPVKNDFIQVPFSEWGGVGWGNNHSAGS